MSIKLSQFISACHQNARGGSSKLANEKERKWNLLGIQNLPVGKPKKQSVGVYF